LVLSFKKIFIFTIQEIDMKEIILVTILSIFISTSVNSQVYLAKQWDHTFGGSNVETLTGIIETSDRGFLLGGFTNSGNTNDITDTSRGGNDFWIVKTDSAGNKQWDKRFGGSFEDKLYSIQQTFDGGYIIGGLTTSDSSGDITQPTRGSMDYWIVKTDNLGNKQWDKRFGGSDYDWLNVVRQTADSGYILGGYSFSDSSGDKSGHRNNSVDFWIVKTNASGIKQWDKTIGGLSTDELYSLQQTADGGYIMGGRTVSDSSVDVSENGRGGYDYWVIKTNAQGVKTWDKRFGGNNNDKLLYLQQTKNKEYILGGFTFSDSTGDFSQPSRDTSISASINRGDAWIIKIDSMGTKKWDKRFGGHWVEDAFGYVKETFDGGYLMGCASYSNISGDKTENNFGFEQSWIVKMDSLGNKKWDKTLYVNSEDEYAYPVQTKDSCYVIANWSTGDSAGYKSENSRGNYDFWFIKFCETSQPQVPIANFQPNYSALCAGGCFDFENLSYNASTFQWSFPGGTPSSSTSRFPTGICYENPGYYSVTLIATNNDSADTLTLDSVIHMLPLPVFNIIEVADTLYGPQNFSFYQWYYNNNPLPGQNSYYTIATQNGDYSLVAVDSNGCPGRDTLFSFNVAVNEFTFNGNVITVYPNPSGDHINISGLELVAGGELIIRDILGKQVLKATIGSAQINIQLSSIKPGIYLIEANKNQQRYFARFVKE
jgi:hypothetical protein